MSAAASSSPSVPPGAVYPLPVAGPEGLLDRAWDVLDGWVSVRLGRRRGRRDAKRAVRVEHRSQSLDLDSPEAVRAALGSVRVGRYGVTAASRAAEEAVAIAAAVARGTWDEAPGRLEVAAALAMVEGRIAGGGFEVRDAMAAALAVAAVAFRGSPVHLLAPDGPMLDAVWRLLDPLAERLGLSIGRIGSETSAEDRQAAYGWAITCGEAREIVTDTLRDHQKLLDQPGDLRLRIERLCRRRPRVSQLLQRGLVVGIVPQADRVLLDHALGTVGLRSGPGASAEVQAMALAYDVAGLLSEAEDYAVVDGWRPVLTRAGRDRLERMLANRGGPWAGQTWRDQVVTLAVSARGCLAEGVHYTVAETGIELVDAGLSRMAHGEYWRWVLRAMLSVREGRDLPPARPQVVTMSYMEGLARYRQLGGTLAQPASSVRGELSGLYGVATDCLAGRRGRHGRVTVHATSGAGEAGQLAIRIVGEGVRSGRFPVLLSTQSAALANAMAGLAAQGIRAGETGPGEPWRREDQDASVMLLEDPGSVLGAFSGGRAAPPNDVVIVGRPMDRRREHRLLGWLETNAPDARIQRVLILEALESAPMGMRVLARLALGSGPASGPARQLYWRVIQRRLDALSRRLRSEHRRSGLRLGKLLAFTGRAR